MNYRYSRPLGGLDYWLACFNENEVKRICFKKLKITKYPDMIIRYVFRVPQAEAKKLSIFTYHSAESLYIMHKDYRSGKWTPVSVLEVVDG